MRAGVFAARPTIRAVRCTARVFQEPFTWNDALNRMLRVFTQCICAYERLYLSVAVSGVS